jgi:hypothetical protein
MLNQVIEKMGEEDGIFNIDSIHDTGLIYNVEYLDPHLSAKEFDRVWHEAESRVNYVRLNNLILCVCSKCHQCYKEIKNLYDIKAQDRISKDFVKNDIPRLHILHHIESLLENKLSVEEIGKSIATHNNNNDKLPHRTLECIYKAALERMEMYVEEDCY